MQIHADSRRTGEPEPGQQPEGFAGVTLREIHRALTVRAICEQRVCQRVAFRRVQGWTVKQIRVDLGENERFYAAAVALLEDASAAVEAEGDLDGGDRPIEMVIGRRILAAQRIVVERVRHAEQILILRAVGWTKGHEIRDKTGLSEKSFKIAARWLRDAGLQFREDQNGNTRLGDASQSAVRETSAHGSFYPCP